MSASTFAEKYKLRLNDQQMAAVEATEGVTLLLAVPGSGKTTTLVSRLGYMVLEKGILPEKIMTMTYTVSAAKDMRARFASFFGEDAAQRIQFRTINSVCAAVLRYYERVFGCSPKRVVTAAQQAAILGYIYRSMRHSVLNEGLLHTLLLEIAKAKNNMTPDGKLSEVDVGEAGLDFRQIFQAYNDALANDNLIDFDDQLVKALEILTNIPNVLHAFQRQYRYWCVDEAQDTSLIQHKIIRMLAGKSPNLFMVGDEDQSIYGFRAAYPKMLLEIEDYYPNAKVLLLETNYRCTPAIVDAANGFIRLNEGSRKEKDMHSAREKSKPIMWLEVKDREDQLKQVTAFAGVCRTETAILYRNNDSGLLLIDRLDRAGIPYRMRGVDSLFFSNKVVQDMCDFLMFALNPCDTHIFERIYYKLELYIKKDEMRTACAACQATGTPILKIIAEMRKPSWSKDSSKFSIPFLNTQRIFELIANSSPAYGIKTMLWEWYSEYLGRLGISIDKCETMRLLAKPCKTIREFLGRLDELKMLIQQSTLDLQCPLTLSTIHSSKGLEYDRVILFDVVDGILPREANPDDKEEEEELKEDRRIFYVGLTRAKNELVMSKFEKDTKSTFSTFVHAMGKRR